MRGIGGTQGGVWGKEKKEKPKQIGYYGQASKFVKEVEELRDTCKGRVMGSLYEDVIGNSYMETIHPSIHRETLRLNK